MTHIGMVPIVSYIGANQHAVETDVLAHSKLNKASEYKLCLNTKNGHNRTLIHGSTAYPSPLQRQAVAGHSLIAHIVAGLSEAQSTPSPVTEAVAPSFL